MDQSASKIWAERTILPSSCPLASATSQKNDENPRAELPANANNEPMPPPTTEPKEVSTISCSISIGGNFLSREVKIEMLSGEGENAAPVSTARGSTAPAEATSIDLTTESNSNKSEKQTAANRSNSASEFRSTYSAEDDFIGDHGIFDENLPPLQLISPTQFFSSVSSPLTNPTAFGNNNKNDNAEEAAEPPVTKQHKTVNKEKVNTAKKKKKKTEGKGEQAARPISRSEARRKARNPMLCPKASLLLLMVEFLLAFLFNRSQNNQLLKTSSAFRMEQQDDLSHMPEASMPEASMPEGTTLPSTAAEPMPENPVVTFTEEDLKKMKIRSYKRS